MNELEQECTEMGYTWRKGLPFPADEGAALVRVFQVCLRIYGKAVYTAETGMRHPILYDGIEDQLPLASLLLHNGHYYTIRNHELVIRSCSKCGDGDTDDHECAKAKVCPSCSQRFSRKHSHKACATRRNFQAQQDQRNFKFAVPKDIFKTSAAELNQSVCFFDFETMPIDGVHTVYAAGWNYMLETEMGRPKLHRAHGKDALETFVTHVIEHCEYTGLTLTLVGFNTSGFDNFFVIQELLRKGYSPDYAISNGSMLKMDVKEGKKKMLRVFDCYRFTSASLRASCKSFALPVEKGDFPHKFMDGWEKLDYIGSAPGREYYYDAEASTDEELAIGTDDWNLLERMYFYLDKDVLATRELYLQLRNFFFDQFSVDVGDAITLSSLAYDIWLNTCIAPAHDVHLPNNFRNLGQPYIEGRMYFPSAREWEIIREAVYGGRCFPTKRHFVSPHYDALKSGNMGYNDLHSGFIYLLDVISLYPTAMKNYLYPVGHPKIVDEAEQCRRWSEAEEELPIGFYKCTITPNQTLYIPPIARKEDGRLKWDLITRESWYTHEDVLNATRTGATVMISSAMIYEKSAYIFANYIDMVFNIKSEGERTGNEVMRNMGKLMMNALYGKQLQLPIMEKSAIARTTAEVSSFQEQYTLTDIHWLPDNSAVILKGDVLNLQSVIEKPSQNGAFVLAYSRTIMERYVNTLDPFRCIDYTASVRNSLWYTDTDSMHMEAYSVGRAAQLEACIGSNLGDLANDFKDGGKIIRAWYLFPKTWACEYINREGKIVIKRKGKGLPERGRLLEDYDKALRGEGTTPFTFEKMAKVGDRDIYIGKEVEPFSIRVTTLTKRLVKAGADKSKGRRFIDNDENVSHPYIN